MDISQEQYDMLMAYFEGKLSAEQEMQFLTEVIENENLKKEFDWEMILRSKQFTEEENIMSEQEISASAEGFQHFESADKHLERVKSVLEYDVNEKSPSKKAPVFRLSKTAQIAAILIVIIVTTALYFIFSTESKPAMVEKKKRVTLDSSRVNNPKPIPAPTINEPLLADNSRKSEEIYQQFYRKYSGTESDPIEVSKYLYAYRAGNYNYVINDHSEDLASKGGNENDQVLRTYILLYQGASYLHLRKDKDAIKKFLEVRRRSSKNDRIYYDATWYLAMAYIQSNNVHEAGKLLKQLATDRNSSYKTEATAVLRLL